MFFLFEVERSRLKRERVASSPNVVLLPLLFFFFSDAALTPLSFSLSLPADTKRHIMRRQ